jgi:hypothetical protein
MQSSKVATHRKWPQANAQQVGEHTGFGSLLHNNFLKGIIQAIDDISIFVSKFDLLEYGFAFVIHCYTRSLWIKYTKVSSTYDQLMSSASASKVLMHQ